MDSGLPPLPSNPNQAETSQPEITYQDRRTHKDRRSNDRHGKYDRRRNRCGKCVHFADVAPTGEGFCLFFQKKLSPEDFACLEFQDKDPSGGV